MATEAGHAGAATPGRVRRTLAAWRGAADDAWYRRRLRESRFSIISDDCWGGQVYQALRLSYQTPFVGLLMGQADFLEIARDPQRWLNAKLTFASTSKYPSPQEQIDGIDYPVGLLDDELELKFLHYGSQSEAREKWKRRTDRLSFDRLLFKFAGDTKEYVVPDELLVAFDGLPVRGVCFTSRPRPDLRKGVHVRNYTTDGALMYQRCLATFDPVDWINGGDGRAGRVDRLVNVVLNGGRR
jgi:uncharacterized protein (DUF1919 family)